MDIKLLENCSPNFFLFQSISEFSRNSKMFVCSSKDQTRFINSFVTVAWVVLGAFVLDFYMIIFWHLLFSHYPDGVTIKRYDSIFAVNLRNASNKRYFEHQYTIFFTLCCCYYYWMRQEKRTNARVIEKKKKFNRVCVFSRCILFFQICLSVCVYVCHYVALKNIYLYSFKKTVNKIRLKWHKAFFSLSFSLILYL